uniref:Uncharacterized protein n=1 Tax=Arundo donax TaxID=35708 RepID=A0A0A9B3Z0_ARUDO
MDGVGWPRRAAR